MPVPLRVHGYTAAELHKQIHLLINNLVAIKDDSGKFLMRLDDGRVIDTKGWNGWEWTHGIGLYGLWQYHSLTNLQTPFDIINDWFAGRLSEGTTKNINTMAALLTMAHVYERYQNYSFLPWLDSWADWAMHDLARTPCGGMQHTTYDNVNTGELWDDTLMMTVLPLAKIGLVLQRPEYIEEAKRQFMVHIKYLFDTETGLFFHGWKFDCDAKGGVGHNFARARWARGNSWITIAIPEFIEMLDLGPSDALRLHLTDTLDAQCRALRALQSEDGAWRTLLDVPESEGSYLEASATAGFAYGMLKAIRKRYISREYQDVALTAVKAVLSRISADGELQDVSFGTAMGHNLQHYKDIPRTSMPYGQSMAIMMVTELLHLFI